MNAVEIEEAVSVLAAEPFDRAEFPFRFLTAFGFKETTVKKLKAGASNASDVTGAVLHRPHIHLGVTEPGKTADAIKALKASPKTAKAKCKFVFATDGDVVEAEELATGEVIACPYTELADHFGFFLPLAGISTVAEIKENPIDIKATGRLNKLYVQLLKDNPDWDSDAKRPALNQFMSRLIFCFFAEDTDIFIGDNLFSACLKQMSDPQSTNTHEVIKELFRAMNTPGPERKAAKIKSWADAFPYVNGGLFSNDIDSPKFSKIARSYLLRIGELDWKRINPDIFGSMIQAVADDDERGSLGMHYTSVPNILKVLDPLFLDDLREQLDEAADNPRKLLNLRKRIANIRVFDPACGSGNFLVIAYIKLREIEAEIIRRRKDEDKKSWIKLTNFYGIEIKSFPAEIARLALLIAEFQCNVRHIGQREACMDVLPLHDTGKIVTGNALRLDWTEVCPPPNTASAIDEDLGGPTGRLALEGNASAETYICGNPPYLGSQWRTEAQQADMDIVFSPETRTYKDLDYVAAWYLKAARYCSSTESSFALVATKTICQGIQVAMLWPLLFNRGLAISFAYRPFTWGNLAKAKAGVTCVVVGLSMASKRKKIIFEGGIAREATNIGPYLIDMPNVIVEKSPNAVSGLPVMDYGNKPSDGGHLILDEDDKDSLLRDHPEARVYLRRYVGSQEFVRSTWRYCLWVRDGERDAARVIPSLAARFDEVERLRSASKGKQSNDNADRPYRFVYTPHKDGLALIVPRVTSENRPYLPVGFVDGRTIIADTAAAAYDAKLWLLAVVASRLHQQWIATVCVRLRTDYRYSNTLGWNTFPVPQLTENDKAALTRCAEEILLAREAYFPATIADMYDPDRMGDEFPLVRAAHQKNDETLERIYIGRRFKNDTERLEKLFDMYTKMIKDEEAKKPKATAKNGRRPKNGNGADNGDET